MNEHYDDAYYAWQRTIGEFGGKANVFKFAPFISPTDTVVDFGAGGGFLLKNLHCARKIGVEIIPEARTEGERLGIEMTQSLNDLADGEADVVISNNALQHTDAPLAHLLDARRVVKAGGLAVFMVGCEVYSRRYHPGEINFQFYSWSPLLLGNLFVRAGFDIVEIKPLASALSRNPKDVWLGRLSSSRADLWANFPQNRGDPMRCPQRKGTNTTLGQTVPLPASLMACLRSRRSV